MHSEYLQHNLLKHITAQVDNCFHGEKISIHIQLKRQTRPKLLPLPFPTPTLHPTICLFGSKNPQQLPRANRTLVLSQPDHHSCTHAVAFALLVFLFAVKTWSSGRERRRPLDVGQGAERKEEAHLARVSLLNNIPLGANHLTTDTL